MRLTFLFSMLWLSLAPNLAAGSSPWNSFTFDGNGFAKGTGSAAILIRDGYLPAPAAAAAPPEDPLPDGTGAVAVFCYQQRSGGKLRSHPAFAPLSRGVVTLAADSLTVAARTDETGFLVLALPPGTYRLRFAGFSKTITVQKGKTSLVAMRGGKRMVD